MGSHDIVPVETWALRQSGNLAGGIFVSSEYLEGFASPQTRIGGVPMDVHPLQASDPLDKDRLAGLGLAVVEVRPDERRSVDRLIQLTGDLPDVGVIAAIAWPDVALVRTLVREGVADVVSLPLQQPELDQVVLDVLARRADREMKLCPMIAVVRANGGCGATTIATQLAGKLADDQWTAAPPLLLDLDVQFGTAAQYLSLDQGGSILDLLQSTERLDDALVDSIAASKDGFSVVAAPEEIVPLASVDIESLLNTVQFMRMHFGVLVLDLPASWTDWSLSLLSECDLVLMASELSLHSLGQAKRNLDLMGSIGIPRDKVRIVLNRVEKRLFGSIRPDDAERTLRAEVIAALPFDEAVTRVQQSGELIIRHARKSRYAQELAKLSESVRGTLDGRGKR